MFEDIVNYVLNNADPVWALVILGQLVALFGGPQAKAAINVLLPLVRSEKGQQIIKDVFGVLVGNYGAAKNDEYAESVAEQVTKKIQRKVRKPGRPGKLP